MRAQSKQERRRLFLMSLLPAAAVDAMSAMKEEDIAPVCKIPVAL